MPIKNYTTTVDVYTTLGQIQSILVKHGARSIKQDYDERGRIVAVSFLVNTPVGMQAVRLPAKTENTLKVLKSQRVNCDYDQAERVAWRIIKDWIDAQMALLETEMVTISEIFLPYMLADKDGNTVYQLFTNNALQLKAPEV